MKSVDNHEQREVRMAEYIEQQANVNLQMVDMFKSEMNKLVSLQEEQKKLKGIQIANNYQVEPQTIWEKVRQSFIHD